MATLTQKLDVAIASQQAEVDRLQKAAIVDLAAAEAKLKQLQELAGLVTPELEQAYAAVKALGITLDTP